MGGQTIRRVVQVVRVRVFRLRMRYNRRVHQVVLVIKVEQMIVIEPVVVVVVPVESVEMVIEIQQLVMVV